MLSEGRDEGVGGMSDTMWESVGGTLGTRWLWYTEGGYDESMKNLFAGGMEGGESERGVRAWSSDRHCGWLWTL